MVISYQNIMTLWGKGVLDKSKKGKFLTVDLPFFVSQSGGDHFKLSDC
jgi:hypothetical protein